MTGSSFYDSSTDRLQVEASLLRQVGRIVSNDDDRFMLGIEREWQVRDGREQLLRTLDFNDMNGALGGRWHGDGGEFAIERRFSLVQALPGTLAMASLITANRVNAPAAV